jgi:hypothetical protein
MIIVNENDSLLFGNGTAAAAKREPVEEKTCALSMVMLSSAACGASCARCRRHRSWFVVCVALRGDRSRTWRQSLHFAVTGVTLRARP